MITLALDAVGVRYGARTVLDHVTVPAMRGGEVVAVIGPNGAGKSTLLRRIAGLVGGPGRVHMETGTPRPARACYLPQDSTATAVLTVFESILLAVKRDASWRVEDEALAKVEALLHLLDIEALAFRNLGELSGGQRQLVSIAQTLGREPDVMLLDEPTSALDLRHQQQVAAITRRITAERGIVTLVTVHDLNQALRIADRVLVLAAGGLAAFGPPREVVTPGLIAEVYGVRVRVEEFGTGRPYVIVEDEA
ncbi:ABC transporter ATP-binding protein [Methylobacterium sp. SyP6R]|uniref:ABC transporter ATP-binding protein n=1 Tax=Methylobacterium sp. SyP6R TaxID=2718876 RepID=UPI001F4428EB|nr:ABC transporter ATP-binding protein [Methylobacterium sp. SyP6R]MCF4127222.1 ABC transporter ATP-binding protein [Methylobacterium sp. SyP6R]